LPQQLLRRLFEQWLQQGPQGQITPEIAKKVGELSDALDQDAEQVYKELSSEQQRIAQALFRRITESRRQAGGSKDDRPVRRPQTVAHLAAVAQTSENELRRVIERFEQRGLLVVRPTDELDKVDLPHECLCLKWKRLEKWIEDEAQDAKTLRFLADSAGKKSHLTGTALTEALLWQEAGRLKEVWGQRYLSSKEVSDVDNWVKESKRRTDRLNQLLKGGFIAMTVLAIAAVVGGLWAFSLYRRAEALAIEAAKQTKAAKENADEAIKQKGIAEHNTKEAKDK